MSRSVPARALLTLSVLLLSAGIAPDAEPASAAAAVRWADEELEPVLVTGERPGPALWKVTHRDHTLWILPTLSPLPDRLVWRSSQVEAAIAQSQEVYSEASVTLTVRQTSARQERLAKALLIPQGRSLRDVMPPDLYAKFSVLSRQHARGDPQLERIRPSQAVAELRQRALRRLQLSSDGGIQTTVEQLARRHGVPFRSLVREDSRGWDTFVSQLERAPMNAEIECARANLDRLEGELREAAARANAWAIGDLSALRPLASSGTGRAAVPTCARLFQSVTPLARSVQESRERAFRALERALRRNQSTFAMVVMPEVLSGDGLLAQFRKAGYRVEEPPPPDITVTTAP